MTPALLEPASDSPVATVSERLFMLVGGAYCATKCLFLAFLAVNTQYVMDEYWQAGQSYYIPEYFRTYVPQKTVLYSYFCLPVHALGDTTAEIMRLARLEMLAVVFLMMGILVFTWRRLGLRRAELIFCMCVLLSFSNFMERSFRARTDSLALFFDVLAVAIACGAPRLGAARAFMSGAVVGLAFLSTQKAVFAAVAIGMAIAVVILVNRDVKRFLRVGSACLLGFVLVLFTYAIILGDGDPSLILRTTVTGPVDLQMNATRYFTNMSVYVQQTLERNVVPYALCVSGLAIALLGFRSLTDAQRLGAVFSLVFAVLVFQHNQPWPYVFVSAIVFLAPWSVFTLRWIDARTLAAAGSARWIVLLVLSFTLVRNLSYLARDNAIQNRVTDQVEQILKPDERYQDGTGMIVTRRMSTVVWWDRLNYMRHLENARHRGDHGLGVIVEAGPKVWIINYRVIALWRFLEPEIGRSYVRVERNILLAGAPLDSVDREFVNRWSGAYSVFGPDGPLPDARIVIDGRVSTTPVLLAPGTFSVRLESPGAVPLFLLPANSGLEHVTPVTAPPLDLYVDVYG